jgi:hypothetical protein
MDSSIIAAVSAILDSAVGGVTTFGTAFVNQRYVARRDVLVKDVANREELYAEFLKEVADLYRESLNRTLNDLAMQPSLITLYSLIGRIRMISNEAVLMVAEKVAEDIIAAYKRPPMTFKEWQHPGDQPIPGTHLLKPVAQSGKACSDACSSSRRTASGDQRVWMAKAGADDVSHQGLLALGQGGSRLSLGARE